MSDAKTAADLSITNYERVDEPRVLTSEEVAEGHREPVDDATEPMFAIMRSDGYVGADVGQHTRSPKVQVLFVSRDGSRAVEKLHRADETDGEHAFEGSYPVVIQRDPEHGDSVDDDRHDGYAQLVADLYDVDGGET